MTSGIKSFIKNNGKYVFEEDISLINRLVIYGYRKLLRNSNEIIKNYDPKENIENYLRNWLIDYLRKYKKENSLSGA